VFFTEFVSCPYNNTLSMT